jgi:response regulator RpfG family c-di-GMP phosphodiesterase
MVESSRVSLVMADQRLKTMSGTQFLREVAQRSPATARVLLASFPENHDILQSEDERIHGILGKPWDGPSLQRTILAILRWQEERVRLQADTESMPLSSLTKPGARRRAGKKNEV